MQETPDAVGFAGNGLHAVLRKNTLLLAILAAAVLPYLVGLGDSTIWDANEAFYAETARVMVDSGDYINPSFNAQPRFNKPVLSYWAVAAAYRLFGASVWSERLPIALGALILIATAFLLGGIAGSHRDGPLASSFALPPALLAAIVLATSPRVLMFARRIIIDVWVTMFMGLTLLFFVLAETCGDADRAAAGGWRRWLSQPRGRYLVLMYVSAGLGVLTKGPVAVALPGLAFLVYFALERRLGDLRRMMIPTGLLIGAAIVVPWYAALYLQHGWVYIREFFIDENLLRYANSAVPSERSWWFYGPVLLTELFPWSLLLPVALVQAWPAVRGRGPSGSPRLRAQRILFVWMATIVLFFTFSRTKQDLYIFPVVMAEAALIGAAWAAALPAEVSPPGAAPAGGPPLGGPPIGGPPIGGIRWSLWTAGVLLGVAGVFLLVAGLGRWIDLAGSLVAAVTVLGGGGVVKVLAWRRRLWPAAAALGLTFAVLSWTFVLLTLPDFERYKPVAPLAQVFKARAGSGAELASFRLGIPSLVFYAERPIRELLAPIELERLFAGDEAYCVMTAEDYASVGDSLGRPTWVLARRPLFDARVRNLVEGTAMPEILLVSNRP